MSILNHSVLNNEAKSEILPDSLQAGPISISNGGIWISAIIAVSLLGVIEATYCFQGFLSRNGKLISTVLRIGAPISAFLAIWMHYRKYRNDIGKIGLAEGAVTSAVIIFTLWFGHVVRKYLLDTLYYQIFDLNSRLLQIILIVLSPFVAYLLVFGLFPILAFAYSKISHRLTLSDAQRHICERDNPIIYKAICWSISFLFTLLFVLLRVDPESTGFYIMLLYMNGIVAVSDALFNIWLGAVFF